MSAQFPFFYSFMVFCTVFLDLCRYKSSVAPAEKPRLVINRQPYIWVCSAFCSTPTRSCSEELLQHSTPLAANDSASQDVITSDKTALAMGATLAAEEEESLTSPQCINTPSPSHFPAGSNGSAAADTSRQQGKAWSESEDLRGGASWTECGLRGTWAPTSYNPSHECPPHWRRTAYIHRFKWKIPLLLMARRWHGLLVRSNSWHFTPAAWKLGEKCIFIFAFSCFSIDMEQKHDHFACLTTSFEPISSPSQLPFHKICFGSKYLLHADR